MFWLLSRPMRALSGFRRASDGGATVEAVLWIPVYLLLGALIADVSMVMNGQARAMRIVQDTNRLAAAGFLATETEVRNEVAGRIAHISPNARITARIDGDRLRTVAVIPVGDLELFGAFPMISVVEVTVASAHMLET